MSPSRGSQSRDSFISRTCTNRRAACSTVKFASADNARFLPKRGTQIVQESTLWKTGLPSGDGEAMPESYNESTNGSPEWFAVYTASHHEKRVFEQLSYRRVETFLPSYKAERQWSKRRPVTLDLPLFPNYVFVHIARGQRGDVLATPGVLSIVGGAQKSWELPDREIEAIRRAVSQRTVVPHPHLAVGKRARVKSGVLAGLEGVIVRAKHCLHFVLNIELIMRSIAIEVAAEELDPVLNSSVVSHPAGC
jgi:transcription antitermination factor NusG